MIQLKVHKDYQAPIVLGLIVLVVLPALILYPFHSDIDIQQVMGFELFRFHGLPYFGTWDSNFPGAIWLHASAIAMFGNSEIGLRSFDLLLQIGVVIALYRISRFWIDRGPALLGVMLYALFYVNGPGQYMSQRDCFAILPLLLGIGAAEQSFRSNRNVSAFAAGVFFALGFWIRPTYALLALAPCMTLFDLRTAKGRIQCVFEAIGFLAIVGLGLLPYALVPNGLQEIYLATIRYNAEIYSHVFTFKDYSRRAWVAVAFIAAWAGSLLWHRIRGTQFTNKPRTNAEIKFLIASIFALLAGVAIMRRLASYHFAPFFCFFMPVLATVIWETIQSLQWKRAALLASIVASFAILYPWKLVVDSVSSGTLFERRFDKLYRSGTVGVVAEYVEARTQPSDAVEVASFFPTVRWRIDRPFVTRFTTPQPLFTRKPDGIPTEYQLEWRREYISRIEQIKPKYFVLENQVDSINRVSTTLLFMSMEGFAPMIARDYRLDTTIAAFYIYARKP